MGNEWEWKDGCEGVQGAEDIDLFRSTSCHAMTPSRTLVIHSHSLDHGPLSSNLLIPSSLASLRISPIISHLVMPSLTLASFSLASRCASSAHLHLHQNLAPSHHLAFTLQNNILGFSLSASVSLTSRLFTPADLTF
jgi:hypothetical protein